MRRTTLIIQKHTVKSELDILGALPVELPLREAMEGSGLEPERPA